jgi:hypothetical protein
MTQSRRMIVIIFVLLFVFQTLSHGEILPTEGTFKGMYHCYRSGIGRFSSSYLIPESLQSKFDKYDGKLIEVNVTKGIQPANPGYAIILDVAEIKELPVPPVSLNLEIIPNKIPANGAFQILVRIKNNSNNTITIKPESVTIAALQVPDDKSEQGDFYSYYHIGQFMSELQHRQLRSVIYSVPWRSYHILGNPSDVVGRVSLEPGQSFPFVLAFDEGLVKGQYEAEAILQYYINNGADSIPVGDWIDFDIGAENTVALRAKSDLALKMLDIKTQYKWFLTNLTVTNNGNSKRMLPQGILDHGEILWLGRIYGWSSDGKEIPLTFENPLYSSGPPSNPFTITETSPGDTVNSEIRFRPMSYFPDNPITRVTCELLTDHGLEPFVLNDTFNDSLFIKPPSYGSEKNGAKCRIRTDSTSYKRGDGILLFWQVVNIKQQPITLTDKNGWTVEIDGKKVKNLRGETKIWGWATKYGPFQPQENNIEIDSSNLSIGKHSVQIFCEGKGGTYSNANNENVPAFKGTLKSNSWTFTLEEK